MDCSGHGTHVAGVIAAKENDFGFAGAAPGVALGAYRVYGCRGNHQLRVFWKPLGKHAI